MSFGTMRKVAIRKRPKKGLLAGLYELPNVVWAILQDEIVHLVKEQQFAPLRIEKLADAKHIFSHIEWRMEVDMPFWWRKPALPQKRNRSQEMGAPRKRKWTGKASHFCGCMGCSGALCHSVCVFQQNIWGYFKKNFGDGSRKHGSKILG